MSFDIVVQGFLAGEESPATDGDGLRALLAPYVMQDRHGENLRYGDGGAEIYGWDDVETGFMVTHVDGRDVWDLLVRAAHIAGFVIIPTGCPVALISAAQLKELPEELRHDTRVVTTGRELIAMVEAS